MYKQTQYNIDPHFVFSPFFSSFPVAALLEKISYMCKRPAAFLFKEQMRGGGGDAPALPRGGGDAPPLPPPRKASE